jgi:hypothetical protein
LLNWRRDPGYEQRMKLRNFDELESRLKRGMPSSRKF